MLRARSKRPPGPTLPCTVFSLACVRWPLVRDVIVTVAHIGVEPDVIQERMRRPDVIAVADSIRSQFPGMKIIVGIDNTEVW